MVCMKSSTIVPVKTTLASRLRSKSGARVSLLDRVIVDPASQR